MHFLREKREHLLLGNDLQVWKKHSDRYIGIASKLKMGRMVYVHDILWGNFQEHLQDMEMHSLALRLCCREAGVAAFVQVGIWYLALP